MYRTARLALIAVALLLVGVAGGSAADVVQAATIASDALGEDVLQPRHLGERGLLPGPRRHSGGNREEELLRAGGRRMEHPGAARLLGDSRPSDAWSPSGSRFTAVRLYRWPVSLDAINADQ